MSHNGQDQLVRGEAQRFACVPCLHQFFSSAWSFLSAFLIALSYSAQSSISISIYLQPKSFSGVAASAKRLSSPASVAGCLSCDPNMTALRYRSLYKSKKTIWLLHVLPGGPNDLIRCELEHVDLDEGPSYIALSYTWDHGGGHDELELCGVQTQVGKNLLNFLRRFRKVNEGYGTRLWIDALCE